MFLKSWVGRRDIKSTSEQPTEAIEISKISTNLFLSGFYFQVTKKLFPPVMHSIYPPIAILSPGNGTLEQPTDIVSKLKKSSPDVYGKQ